MKKLILYISFTLISLTSFSQIVGEWVVVEPEYKWDDIYEHYSITMNYDVTNDIEKYVIKQTITTFVKYVNIRITNDNNVTIKTIDNTYYGKWTKNSNRKYNVYIKINNETSYYSLKLRGNDLILTSFNDEFERIRNNFLASDVILREKIIL